MWECFCCKKGRLMKSSSIEKIVKKAITKIDTEDSKFGTNRVKMCFFDSKNLFVPKQIGIPGDPRGSRIDLSDFVKESDKRIRTGRKLFSGVVVYDPYHIAYFSSTSLCPVLADTLDSFKQRDSKFHCILARDKKSYVEYRK